MAVAKSNNIKRGEKIIREIKAIVRNWKDYANRVNVDKKLKDLISENLVALK